MRAAGGRANVIVPSERSGHESNIGLSWPHTSSESIFICLVITDVSIKRWPAGPKKVDPPTSLDFRSQNRSRQE